MIKKVGLFSILILSLLPLAFVFAQDNAETDVSGGTPQIEITGVNASELPVALITANVVDSLGQPVAGLTESDFTLTGDLAEFATISSVENVTDDDLSFAVVLVIDVSSSMAGTPIERVQESALLFVEQIGESDPVAVLTFNQQVNEVQDFTTDKDQLRAVLSSLPFGGQTALYEAAIAGINKASESPEPRRAVILLSDGAEFGGVSISKREDALERAIIEGVPVYTIGLGFGTDRTYLDELSLGTNARSLESPTPDELEQAYTALAQLFRSQYVITLDADVPLDGTEYSLGLQANTPEGVTDVDTAILRAPIPVPIVNIETNFDAPLTETTDVIINVAADDELSSLTATIGDQMPVDVDTSTSPVMLQVDPFTYAPGEYSLVVQATDIDGDLGEAATMFTVDAIPARADVSVDLAALGEISEATTIEVSVEEQTPTMGVRFSVDGVEQAVVREAPYSFVLEPILYSDGEHTLSIEVVSESGAINTIEQNFTLAQIPPQFSIDLPEVEGGVISEATDINVDVSAQVEVSEITLLNGDNVLQSVSGQNQATLTIDPVMLPPGQNTLTIQVTDANGLQSSVDQPVEIAALPPEVSLSGLTEGMQIDDTITFEIVGSGQTEIDNVTMSVGDVAIEGLDAAPFVVTLDPLDFEPGVQDVVITVENAGGQSTTLEFQIEFLESVFLTATPPTPTPTIDFEATNVAGTEIAVATEDAQATSEAIFTQEAQETQDAVATVERATEEVVETSTAEIQTTLDFEATSTRDGELQLTFEAEATTDFNATEAIQATTDAEVAALATIDAQALAVARETDEAIETEEFQATQDAMPTETPTDEPTATDEPTEEPTDEPTVTDEPTEEPTDEPTATDEPTEEPTATDEPTEEPTDEPTATEEPTDEPTATDEPSETPTDEPTEEGALVATVTDEELEPTPTVFDPTATPIGELTDIQAQSEQAQDNTLLFVGIGIALLIVLIILATMLRRPGQN